MADLPNRRDIPMTQLTQAIREANGNPLLAIQTSMDLVSEVLGGTAEFVDASNPTVAVWSAAAALHSAAILENLAGLRSLYANLAVTPEEAYHHMDYKAYLNRFGSPGTADITFNINFQQFQQFMVRVPDSDYSMIVIPRDSLLTVDGTLFFTLQYPIEIKFYDSQALQVSYDTSIPSPLQSLSTNIIDYALMVDPSSRGSWIRFTVPMMQMNREMSSDNIQAGRYLVKDIEFSKQYYFARAFYRDGSQGDRWIEMETTHSPKTYDPRTPTVKLKVIDQILNVSLPLIYQNSMGLTGEFRVDVYTTEGDLHVRMENIETDKYVLDMTALDVLRDSTPYTAAAGRVSMQMWCRGELTGGKNGITFPELIQRIKDNSLGEVSVPITDKQIGTASENRGFDLVPYVDVTTNRLFKATRRLPLPSDTRLMTSANVGVATYITENPTTLAHPWILTHGDRTTFLSKNLYRSVDGKISVLTKAEVDSISAMTSSAKINQLNRNKYLYSPFYYVVDKSGLELDLRPYHLDQPEAMNLNFVQQNQTLQLPVNTSNYFLRKTERGYELTIQTKSGSFYKQLGDSEVNAQLGIRLSESSRFGYWNGVQTGKTEDGERIFTFYLDTNYDIDERHQLCLTNGVIESPLPTPVWVGLQADLHIFHTTTSIPAGTYRPDSTQDMIGVDFLPSPSAAITHEIITAKFGNFLQRLWRRARPYPDIAVYKKYTIDVPMVFEKDVYDVDPATGSSITIKDGKIEYNQLFKAGEEVKDEHGNVILAHKAGDNVMQDGNLIVDSNQVGTLELDMFFVDGRHYFVTDEVFLEYNREFISIVNNWVLRDMQILNQKTFEKTEVLFYPNNQLSSIMVLSGEGKKYLLPSEQSLTVDIYVSDALYRDTDQRERIEEKTIRYVDKWISEKTVAVSVAIKGLSALYGDVASGVALRGLGGDANLQILETQKDEDRFCLKRNLQVQQDGSFIIREAVTVNFYRFGNHIKED